MCSAPSCSWTYRNFGERGPRPRRAIKTRPKRQRGANLMVPASDCFSSHEECERQSASCLDDRPGIAAFRSSLSPAAGSRRRPGQRPGARIVRSLTEGCAPHGPRAAMCAGRASPVSGSHYRRARGREDRANRQPALLRRREMTSPQAAARPLGGWGQAGQRQEAKRRRGSRHKGGSHWKNGVKRQHGFGPRMFQAIARLRPARIAAVTARRPPESGLAKVSLSCGYTIPHSSNRSRTTSA